jgi:hypothetical protein
MSGRPDPEFQRDQVLVCMVLAFCGAAGFIAAIYRAMG